jgi:circadian clock protein KaiB
MSNAIPHADLAQADDEKVVLRLYVAGSTPRSSRAITNIKALCESNLKDRYLLTVVDLYQEQARAQQDDIVVAPTLIRQSPGPVRRLFGDMSQTEDVRMALNIPLCLRHS